MKSEYVLFHYFDDKAYLNIQTHTTRNARAEAISMTKHRITDRITERLRTLLIEELQRNL